MKDIIQIWQQLLDTGAKNKTLQEKQKIRLLNSICLTIIAITILYALVVYLFPVKELYMLPILTFPVFGIPFVLNYFNLFHWAKWVFALAPTALLGYLATQLGGQTGLQYAFIIQSTIPLLFFTDWKVLTLFFIYNVGAFFGILEYLHYYPPATPFDDFFFFAGNMLSIFVVLILVVQYFRNEATYFRKKMELKNRDLQRRSDELRQFYYAVAHDLRSPVRGIHHLLEYAEEDFGSELSAEAIKNLHMIRLQVIRLENLTSGILEYSAASQGNENAKNIHLKDALKTLADQIHAGSSYTITISPGVPETIHAPEIYKQVFFELIENSMKFHDRENGKIEIDCVKSSTAYSFVVKDDGPGIPNRFHDRIFELFETLEPKSKSGYAGAGLAIARKIVEDNGGTIRVESNPGEGAAFYFTLPFHAVESLA